MVKRLQRLKLSYIQVCVPLSLVKESSSSVNDFSTIYKEKGLYNKKNRISIKNVFYCYFIAKIIKQQKSASIVN